MEATTLPPRSFFSRVWIYFMEMFPVHIYIPYVIALYACLNFTTQLLYDRSVVIDSQRCGRDDHGFLHDDAPPHL